MHQWLHLLSLVQKKKKKKKKKKKTARNAKQQQQQQQQKKKTSFTNGNIFFFTKFLLVHNYAQKATRTSRQREIYSLSTVIAFFFYYPGF